MEYSSIVCAKAYSVVDSLFVTKNALLMWQWVICVDIVCTENTTPIMWHIINNAYNSNEIRDDSLLNLWFQLSIISMSDNVVTGLMSTELLDIWLFYWEYGWKDLQMFVCIVGSSVIGWIGHLSTFNFKLAFKFGQNIKLFHLIYLFEIKSHNDHHI